VKKHLKKLIERISDRVDLQKSRSIDIESCRTVCLALGPYRNLTTLTAATLFLHPNCQVLNHAGNRIYGREEVDFLSGYTDERFERFVQFAIQISTKGQRGDFGGSIVHSHAFDAEHRMRTLHQETGAELLKREIHCLFWKESLITANLIRDKKLDLGAVFARNRRLRFLMPIRNPLDSAVSNLKTGHVNLFKGLSKQSPVADVVKAILGEFAWFARLEQKHPGRFFRYFEHEISREMLLRMAEFLQLAPDEGWLSKALVAMETKPSYPHDEALKNFYREQVDANFGEFEPWRAGLLRFVA